MIFPSYLWEQSILKGATWGQKDRMAIKLSALQAGLNSQNQHMFH